MSGCDRPVMIVNRIEYDFIVGLMEGPAQDKPKLRALLAEKHCDCDHGEDDPCCTETEDPTDDAA